MFINSIAAAISENRQFLKLFEDIAETITNEYIEEASQAMQRSGSEMSFEQIMKQVDLLHQELTLKAAWCRDSYKEAKGRPSANLPRSCKKIIKRCLTNYIFRVKTLISIGVTRETPRKRLLEFEPTIGAAVLMNQFKVS